MIFHSPTGEIVVVKNAQEIYKNVSHPTRYISLDDAYHVLTKREDSIYVGNMISAWVRKYLPEIA
mgnify:CR=1